MMRRFLKALLLALGQSLVYLLGYHLLYTYGPSMLSQQRGVSWGLTVIYSLYFFVLFSIIDWTLSVYRPNWHFLFLLASLVFFGVWWFPLWSRPGLLLSLTCPAILAYLIAHLAYKRWGLRV